MKFSRKIQRCELSPMRKFLPYELAEGMGATRKILENLPKGADIAVFIGPEGGFAP